MFLLFILFNQIIEISKSHPISHAFQAVNQISEPHSEFTERVVACLREELYCVDFKQSIYNLILLSFGVEVSTEKNNL